MSLVDLARATGYTDRQIRRLENGETPIKARHVTVLEAALSGKAGAKAPGRSTPKRQIA